MKKQITTFAAMLALTGAAILSGGSTAAPVQAPAAAVPVQSVMLNEDCEAYDQCMLNCKKFGGHDRMCAITCMSVRCIYEPTKVEQDPILRRLAA